MTKYLIHSPRYNHLHGGIRALHTLTDMLTARGVDAELVDLQPSHIDAVHIWPEIMPATGPRAVGWLLAPRIHPAGDEAVYTWEPWIELGRPILQVPIIDLELFHPPARGTQRRGIAVYLGKGTLDPDATHQLVADVKTAGYDWSTSAAIRREWPANRVELADLLRSSALLVCWDGLTALALEAALCGCPVLFAGDAAGARMRHTFNVTGANGYAYTADELDRARISAADTYEHYLTRSLPRMDRSIDAFIEATA